MTYSLRTFEAVVGESLKKCAALAERTGAGRWNFILSNGSALLVSAHADEHWLHLDAPIEMSAAIPDSWGLVGLNAGLNGLAKLTLPAGRQSLHLRAEFPLDEEIDIAGRLLDACAGFKSAAGRLHGEKVKVVTVADEPAAPVRGADEAGPAADEAASQLGGLCEQAGWQSTEKSATRLAVDIEAGGAFYQVIAEKQGARAMSLSVELARGESLAEPQKLASGDLLLRASAAVRLARATVAEDKGQASARFEVVFTREPCAEEFGHALSALSVACALCGREVAAVMRDESLAERYLALRGAGPLYKREGVLSRLKGLIGARS